MQKMVIDNLTWRYFLALEKDFIDTFDYIEICPAHDDVYSLKYRAIILQTCSEIDKIFKMLMNVEPDANKNIGDYRTFIGNSHIDFIDINVIFPKLSTVNSIQPWHGWTAKTPPSFWKDGYNKIKHQGDITKATQKYTIHSLSALFSLLLALYKTNNGSSFSECPSISMPLLFDYSGLDSNVLVAENSNNVNVPGFN